MQISELFRIITFYKFFKFLLYNELKHSSEVEKIYIFSRILHICELFYVKYSKISHFIISEKNLQKIWESYFSEIFINLNYDKNMRYENFFTRGNLTMRIQCHDSSRRFHASPCSFLNLRFCAILSHVVPLVIALPRQRKWAFLRDVKARCLKSLSLQGRLSEILNSVRVVWTTGVRRNRVSCFEKGLTADTFAYIRIYLFCTLPSLTLAWSTSVDRFDEAFVSTLGCVCGLHFDGRTIDSLWTRSSRDRAILLDFSANRIFFKANGALSIENYKIKSTN